MTRLLATVPPGEVSSEQAERARDRLVGYLERHNETEIPIHVECGTDDEAAVLPRQVAQLVAQMLSYLADGEGVAVLPHHKMLTTQEAADMLNVSRPYVIKLLESNEIDYEMVGRHRRVRLVDLLDYKREMQTKTKAAADALSRLGQELGT